MHLFGELREGRGPVQDDQRHAALLGGAAQCGRRGRESPAEAEDHGGDICPVHGLHVRGLRLRIVGQQQPGGQHDLAAGEHHPDVQRLGDVHPAHRPVKTDRPGDHLGAEGRDEVEPEHVTHRHHGWRV